MKFYVKSLSYLMHYFVYTAQIVNTQTELKNLAEQNPELKDAYLAKQRRLKVSKFLSVFF